VRRRGYIHHFNVRAEGINRADIFLRSISAQLIAVHHLPVVALPPDAGRDAGFLVSILEDVSRLLSPSERVVIVIDALDEVELEGHPGANCLYLPVVLPDGIFILATMREDAPVPLLLDCEHQALTIRQDSEQNRRDIDHYLVHVASSPSITVYRHRHGLTEGQFVDLLAERSEGNFMYLHYVIPEVRSGAFDKMTPSAIPAGLNNYYEAHWRRMQAGGRELWIERQLPVLMALTPVDEPLSLDRIVEFSGVADKRAVRYVLSEWGQYLERVTVSRGSRTEVRYRLYHESFRDFLRQKDEMGDLPVSFSDARMRAAQSFSAELFDGE